MATDFRPLAAPIPKAAGILGLGESKTKQLIRDRTLETVAIGRRRLVLYESMERYIQSLRGKPADARRNDAVPRAGSGRRGRTPASDEP
jgi:hypothetical protein